MTRRAVVTTAFAAVLAVVAALAWWHAIDRPDGKAAARSAVMAAAAQATTTLMTQRPGDPAVRGDVAAVLTGRLADEYASQGADVVLPGALGQQMSLTARVVGTGVADLHGSRARVLLFVDLWAAPKAAAGQPERVALVRWAAMRNVDGTWLLAGLTPVGGAVS
ncbi:hypothetical protein [Gordonia crocea]|uniref:Mce-associated membrane protein n=1 Tax=Gordonia crocea TaxID=589162 RepID=A0A7I9V2V6_9ACTN|nr:hypothetical protein [Gordonia crocea]GED99370.1 hypothetical protein nbrc107697_34090 [Gordonia crocea]